MGSTFRITLDLAWGPQASTTFPATSGAFAFNGSAVVGRTVQGAMTINVPAPTDPADYQDYLDAGCVPVVPDGMKGRKIMLRAMGGTAFLVYWQQEAGDDAPDPVAQVIAVDDLLLLSCTASAWLAQAVLYGSGQVEWVVAGE